MKKLIFEKVSLLSRKEKAAVEIEFGPKINVVQGDNDTGKSSLIKSLYFVLGCAPAKTTKRWDITADTCELRFELSGKHWSIVRQGDVFGLFDGNGALFGAYQGITKEGGIGQALADLVDFRLILQDKRGVSSTPAPAHYFLPYYIDQDAGWHNLWKSFDRLDQFPDYRRHLIDYHTGIKPNRYFLLSSQIEANVKRLANAKQERDSMESARKQFREIKGADFSIDVNAYKAEIQKMLAQCEALRKLEEQYRGEIFELENRRIGIRDRIHAVNGIRVELDADYKVLLGMSRTNTNVDCPTCGTVFENALIERFSLLDDAEKCAHAAEELSKELRTVESLITKVNARFSNNAVEISDLNAELSKKTGKLEMRDIIRSEGVREARKIFDDKIDLLNKLIGEVEESIEDAKKQRAKVLNAKTSELIRSTYKRKMQEFLPVLDVHTVSDDELDKMGQTFKTAGSDLPRALLAQYYALLHTMAVHSPSFIASPVIVDSPIQQDPDYKNIPKILGFALEHKPKECQLILGTVDMHGVKFEGKDIRLIDKQQLLDKGSYSSVSGRLTGLLDRIFKKLDEKEKRK